MGGNATLSQPLALLLSLSFRGQVANIVRRLGHQPPCTDPFEYNLNQAQQPVVKVAKSKRPILRPTQALDCRANHASEGAQHRSGEDHHDG
jgi:hypothetical protein